MFTLWIFEGFSQGSCRWRTRPSSGRNRAQAGAYLRLLEAVHEDHLLARGIAVGQEQRSASYRMRYRSQRLRA